MGKPYIVVLNKIDLVRKEKDAAVANAGANLDIGPETVLPISALKQRTSRQWSTRLSLPSRGWWQR
jgi:GTPase Era involved in 16S rRNA processing